MYRLLPILRDVTVGKSPIRSYLNQRLSLLKLEGKVIDLGSGSNQEASTAIQRGGGVTFTFIDQKVGDHIDFERDALPFDDHQFDTVLLLNVLEHLFNYEYFLGEILRIKKEEGRLIGFVPFLTWFHPDPKDYFRYTNEALEEIFLRVGYTRVEIEPIYSGPYVTAFHMIHTSIPKFLRGLVFIPAYVLDILFRKLRPHSAKRYALGYFFIAV